MNNIENLEKLFATWEKTTEQLWDLTRQTMGSMSFSQDHVEKYLQSSLQHGLKAREEGGRLAQELMVQLKSNQLFLQKMMEDTVVGSFRNWEMPRLVHLEDLYRR